MDMPKRAVLPQDQISMRKLKQGTLKHGKKYS
jgi:hypothetical protein